MLLYYEHLHFLPATINDTHIFLVLPSMSTEDFQVIHGKALSIWMEPNASSSSTNVIEQESPAPNQTHTPTANGDTEPDKLQNHSANGILLLWLLLHL